MGRDHDQEIDRVAIGGHDQAPCSLDAGAAEDLLIGRVGHLMWDVPGFQLVEMLVGDFDGAEGMLPLPELQGNLPANSTEAAHNVVIAQPVQPPIQGALPPQAPQLTAGEVRRKIRGSRRYDNKAKGNDHEGPGPTGCGQGVYLLEANRKDRDGGHIERVEPGPALDDQIAYRAGCDPGQQAEKSPAEAIPEPSRDRQRNHTARLMLPDRAGWVAL